MQKRFPKERDKEQDGLLHCFSKEKDEEQDGLAHIFSKWTRKKTPLVALDKRSQLAPMSGPTTLGNKTKTKTLACWSIVLSRTRQRNKRSHKYAGNKDAERCSPNDRKRCQIRDRSHTCSNCPRTVTAPPAPKLIPKGVLGVSIWVEILLDKFASHRPTERLLGQWQLLGLDVAPGTVAGGLERLEPLFQPLYDALLKRNAASPVAQADETRWMVFVTLDGKTGYRWWLWVFLGEDTVVFRLDPTRSHEVPEGHFPKDARVVLMVDRYSAYKAMDQVKLGNVVLVFCWAHVRRDFIKVGKGWAEHKEWALAWLRRIRALYHHDRRRRSAKPGSADSAAADIELRQTVAAMQTQADAELADPKLPTPCRNVLTSLQEHWSGLTRFLDDARIPLDNNASERRARGPALGRKNYYGSGALWSGRLAAMLFSLFATLSLAKINIRTWLTWYLECCAENVGQVPSDINPFLPWKMSGEKRRELAIDPKDTS